MVRCTTMSRPTRRCLFPFPDALQEFEFETISLPAPYGFHSGAALNAVTKSGTNDFHGSSLRVCPELQIQQPVVFRNEAGFLETQSIRRNHRRSDRGKQALFLWRVSRDTDTTGRCGTTRKHPDDCDGSMEILLLTRPRSAGQPERRHCRTHSRAIWWIRRIELSGNRSRQTSASAE